MTAREFLFLLMGLAALTLLGAVALRGRMRIRRVEGLLTATSAKLENLQLLFGRFVPAEVVERLTGERADFPPERRTVTILFADLRDFTALCDRLDPAVSVNILNGYFQCMSRAIARHHGHLTELIGDGLLALFGALEPNPWQGLDSVLAALEMRAELARYNARLRAESLPELRFGIGIHSGDVIAGIMGAGALNKFGIAGDPINVASRVEGLTKVHQVDLLITGEVRAALDGRFRVRPMPAVPVKGKSEPLVTYFVEGMAEESTAAGAPTAAG
jgi:adenylate cyclase